MLQATVPAGHHVVTVRYWPTSFVLGLVLAALGILAYGRCALRWSDTPPPR